MDVSITPTHTGVGWDIVVAAKADKEVTPDKNEVITHVKVVVNDFTQLDENVNPPAKAWQITLHQQGQFPGPNKVVVTVVDGNDADTNWHAYW